MRIGWWDRHGRAGEIRGGRKSGVPAVVESPIATIRTCMAFESAIAARNRIWATNFRPRDFAGQGRWGISDLTGPGSCAIFLRLNLIFDRTPCCKPLSSPSARGSKRSSLSRSALRISRRPAGNPHTGGELGHCGSIGLEHRRRAPVRQGRQSALWEGVLALVAGVLVASSPSICGGPESA